MALCSAIILDALVELKVYQDGESLSAADAQRALLRLQNMIDAWAADRLTLSLQLRTAFTVTSGHSTVTIGTGGDVSIVRPMWINALNYQVPSSSPTVEAPIGLMDEDAYAAISTKTLTSALPIQAFYQTNLTDALGTLFLWPTPSQNLTLVLYTPQAVTVPASLNTDLIGPPGYAEAFMYQLALRLAAPFGAEVTPDLRQMAAEAFARMKRPNVEPGLLGMDPGLTGNYGAGYNVLTDNWSARN